ncbi:Chromodomain-helicase-DNA-binding protein 1-like [Heracleum sosnowskyi]|uniref:Chromodomain-helicase-DNA-binding protein 1-like n=1 Tax=Heracleum sosnowskyi TaxID=360622 RepID=A0AAD8N0F9_9APIA|nr:Chromodomain-helicase-DNA-binding protein 1-like [Heracleum sosnowskyi]
MPVPPGVTIPATFIGSRPVCKLIKCLYGLRQAPREWFTKFSKVLLQYGFTQSKADSSLFVLHTSQTFTALLVYVDDIILTGSSDTAIVDVKSCLQSHFKLKDLGHLHYFLGIEIARSSEGIYIHQRKDTTFSY